MLKNAKIGVKVLLAFGVVILLSLCIVISLLTEMNNIAKTTTQLYNEPYAASNDMWIIRRNLVDIQRVLNKLSAVDRDAIAAASQTADATLSADAAAIDNAISDLDRLFTGDSKMLSMLSEIKTFVSQGAQIRAQISDLIQKGEQDKARDMIENSYEPLFNTCNEKVLALFDIVETDAANFVAAAQTANRRAIITGIVLLIAGVILAAIITVAFTRMLVRPLKQLERAAVEMSRGNLKVANSITYHSRDEMGYLADSLRTTMTNLSAYVDEISGVLLRLAEGDLTVPSSQITDFLGDFSAIKSSFIRILKSFNTTLGDINQSAAQVNSGSSQVSSAAQNLSQGAAEQASAIEDLTLTVEEISGQIKENAENASSANTLTDQVSLEVEESNRQMQQMNTAMMEISNSSKEIGKIIKTIEDIAFQTNILALNAAVEAARAGAAGKGFAVVADEVRSLASKSAEASKSTASLIEGSVRAVENGTIIAETTARSLETVVSNTRIVAQTVDKIARASVKQANSVEQVTNRVEQISGVVQTNSATAQQSAAASEELSTQAALLNGLVGRFRLFGENAAPAPTQPAQIPVSPAAPASEQAMLPTGW